MLTLLGSTKFSQLRSCDVFPASSQSIALISSLCIIRYIQIQNNFFLFQVILIHQALTYSLASLEADPRNLALRFG